MQRLITRVATRLGKASDVQTLHTLTGTLGLRICSTAREGEMSLLFYPPIRPHALPVISPYAYWKLVERV